MVNFNEIKNVTSDPNQMWLLWKNLFLNTLDMHAPISESRIRGNNLPYITAEMRKLIRTRDYLKKKANKTGSKYLHQAFQQIRNKVKYGIRKLRSEYYQNKIEENRGDLTLYNVCSVHRGMLSTSGVFSRSGGHHEYIGGIS